MKRLYSFDLIILSYLAVISVIIALYQPAWWGVYLAYHLSVIALIAMVAYAHERYDTRFWEIIRYWYVIPVVLGIFRELHYLFVDPACPPFDGLPLDQVLAAIDHRFFGDVHLFFMSLAQPHFIDFLYLCYWSYYLLIIVPAAIPFLLGDRYGVRESISILVAALCLSYLGYFLVPAVGPHQFFVERPLPLNGWMLGDTMHNALLAMEWRMPDAFPSGHTLVSVVALFILWRRHRPTFWVLLIPAIGCIWATMALRYHYVVDVVAGLALAGPSLFIGIQLNAWWERKRDVSITKALQVACGAFW